MSSRLSGAELVFALLAALRPSLCLADVPSLSQLDAGWPLDARTAFRMVLDGDRGLDTDQIHWTGTFFRGGRASLEGFTVRVYENPGGRPGDVLYEAVVRDVTSERLEGYVYAYSAVIPRLVLPAGAATWIEVQAMGPAIPQWGLLRIVSPATSSTRLLRAPEMGVYDWTHYPWLDGGDPASHGCDAFHGPEYVPGDSTGGGGPPVPSVDFSTPVVRPNPTTGFVRVSFTLFKAVRLDVGVYDVSGRRIRTLVDEERPDGPILVIWDGRNDVGEKLQTGIYFVRVMVNGDRFIGRKVLYLGGDAS